MVSRLCFCLLGLTLFPAANCGAQQTVKVFILSGQSNMVGWAHQRTLPQMADDPDSAALHDRIVDDNGEVIVRNDVWIYSNTDGNLRHGPLTIGYGGGSDGDWLGPELALGIRLGDHFEEPVLLVKAAWGGKDLYCDFRPPNAEQPAYQIPSRGDEARDVGAYYRQLVQTTKQAIEDFPELFPALADHQLELAGFVWFQGWNEMFADQQILEQAIAEYPKNYAAMIQGLSDELGVELLPSVVGEMSAWDPGLRNRIEMLQAAQAAVAEQAALKGSVRFVATSPFWDQAVQAAFEGKQRLRSELVSELTKQIEIEYRDELAELEPELARRRVDQLRNRRLNDLPEWQAAEANWNQVGSHWLCHYHGSAKMYCRIGDQLAIEMIGLLREQASAADE